MGYVYCALLNWKMPQEVCRHKIQLLHTDTLMAKDSWGVRGDWPLRSVAREDKESAFRRKHLGEPPKAREYAPVGLDNADEYVHFKK